MQKTFMRIPYTGPLPAPRIVPADATTPHIATAALAKFLTTPPSTTVILSGAGISVASGLADYRGSQGTYTQNKTYRPIYYHEFVANHEARRRYWARSFLGWTTLHRARPNAAHWAIKRLGEMGLVSGVITQSVSAPSCWLSPVADTPRLTDVDSFHNAAHPALPTLELHGYLRSLVCLTCGHHQSREIFQRSLTRLNPAWAAFLDAALRSGALDTENPAERRAKGMKTNPDGDVDLPNAPYSTFRYPACPQCMGDGPRPAGQAHATRAHVHVDDDGAWTSDSTAGILKPAVVMFGESIAPEVKLAAEQAIDQASRVLVLGSSLATYSAWRLVRRAREHGKPIGIVNLGGVRGEDTFFAEPALGVQPASGGLRLEMPADQLLPAVVDSLDG